MRRAIAKLALGCAGIGMCGSLAGVGLANYAASGSFEFYRQQGLADWQQDRPSEPAGVWTADPAFASDRRAGPEELAPEEALASLNR